MVKDQRGYRRTGSEEIAVNPEAGEISHGKNFFRDKRMTTCKGCGDKGTFFSFLSPVTQKYKSDSGQSRGASKLMAIYLQANEPSLHSHFRASFFSSPASERPAHSPAPGRCP